MKYPKLFDRYFDAVDFQPNLRQFIMEELSAPSRHWHGLVHHSIMLNEVAESALLVSRRANPSIPFETAIQELRPDDFIMAGLVRAGIVATFFHDIVYDATRSDNEEASVATMKLWLDPDRYNIALLEDWILATKTHDVAHHMGWGKMNFLTADMSILWTPNPTLYAFYADGIRAEYHHVPNADYRKGRAAVLEELRRFPTQDMMLDRNIDWELSELQQGAFDL